MYARQLRAGVADLRLSVLSDASYARPARRRPLHLAFGCRRFFVLGLKGMQLKSGAVILARWSSSRFYGKALANVAGKPLIDHVIDRARRIGRVDDLVLATSNDVADNRIADHAVAHGVTVFRGSLDDVSNRVLSCARCRGWTHFARINGDCPFLDPALIDKAINTLIGSKLDMVTNVLTRSYPYGVSAEVFLTAAMERAYQSMTEPEDFEHVSRYCYRNPDAFRIHNLVNPAGDWSDVHLTVDKPADVQRLERMVAALDSAVDSADTKAIVATYRATATTKPRQTAPRQAPKPAGALSC